MSRLGIAVLVLLAALAAGAGLWILGADDPVPPSTPPATPPPLAASQDAQASAADARVAEPDYERCMALAIEDPERAVAAAQRWRSEGGGDAALHCEAMARLQGGDAQGAAERLELLGREGFAPRDARAALLAQAGQLWLEEGEFDQAYAAATLALVLRPDDAALVTDRAVIAATSGRFDEAIEDLTRVIDLRPAEAEAYVLRASAWRQSGQPALARDDINRALERDRANQEAWLESGLLKRDAADAAGARADWQRAISLGPDSATASLAARNIAALAERADAAPQAVPLPTPPQPPPAPTRQR